MNMKKQKHNVNYVCRLNHITLHPTLHILQKWHTWTESSPKMYFDQTQAMSDWSSSKPRTGPVW